MRLRPRPLAAAVVVVLVFVMLGLWLRRDRGPRFQGQPVSHWFPRLVAVDGEDRTPTLAALSRGGPEVVPLLVAAANIQDGRLARRYQRWLPKLPELISKRLPTLRYSSSMQVEVAGIIWRMPVSEAICRAMTNALPEFPGFLQGQVVRWMARAVDHETIVGPCLLRVLNGTNDGAVMAAAQSLLLLPGTRSQEAGSIVRELAGRPESIWTNGWTPAPISMEIAVLGRRATGAEAWMLRWLASSNSQLRACATVTLPAVAPERFPLVDTFLGQVSGFNARDIRTVLDPHRMLNTRETMDWSDLILTLAPFLDPSVPGTNEIRGISVTVGPTARNALVHGLIDLIEPMGAEAATVRPVLVRAFAGMEPGTLGAKTARILARFGPVAPETIPDLLPGLDRLPTAPTMVLLLAAYGREAKSAIPRLRAMAAGQMGFVDVVRPQFSPALARRYGLRSLPDALKGDGVVAVWPDLALSVGLTNVWPIPSEARGVDRLVWAPASTSAESETSQDPLPEDAFLLPPVSLSDLAAEALRRIER
ncbi:MAG: hypothetical protein JNK85_18215 [Verrucomicrobiales bacterium]|nr:hypothetical protein [Verrucomicrobiales bacterium]